MFLTTLVFFFVFFSQNSDIRAEGKRNFRKQYTIHFRIDRWEIDTTFLDNAATIRKMHDEIDSLLANGIISPDSISIVSAASPDGNNGYNIRLSEKRGLSAQKLLQSRHPEISPDIIFRNPLGEDWSTMRTVIADDKDMPMREEFLKLLDSGIDNDAMERRLRTMRPLFRYIMREYADIMRIAAVTFNISMPEIALEKVDDMGMPVLAIAEGKIAEPGNSPRPEKPAPATHDDEHTRKMILAARTNLLVPALNVGMEIPVGYNFSLGLDYYYPWWLAASNKYCMEMLGWFVDGKYWFGKNRGEEDKLTGHALGAYAGFGYYDYQWLNSGNQGEYIDLGIDYTYSVPLAKDKLRMEFNVGLGWIHTVARHYTPTDDYADLIKDPGIKHRKYNFFGPTRASVSLIVPIRVKTSGKGGRK